MLGIIYNSNDIITQRIKQLKTIKQNSMEEAIKVLRHAESVLVKKIKAMKDGKPKYAASGKLEELRDGIKAIQAAGKAVRNGWANEWPTMPVGH